jgi:hypothetical protein
MGTDIHLVAEVFKNNQWHLAETDLPNYRNYVSFAILADVRNGYGFAGFDTGEPVVPISYPRDIPRDISIELMNLLARTHGKYLYLGDHSFSWVTLEELLAYDLDQMRTCRGMVSAEEAIRCQQTGSPPRHPVGWHASPDWVKISWEEPLRDQAPLILDLIEALLPLGKPGNVRLVFGFDN